MLRKRGPHSLRAGQPSGTITAGGVSYGSNPMQFLMVAPAQIVWLCLVWLKLVLSSLAWVKFAPVVGLTEIRPLQDRGFIAIACREIVAGDRGRGLACSPQR